MNCWELPDSIEIGGAVYELNTDYRDVLEIIKYLEDLKNVDELCDLFDISTSGFPSTMDKLTWRGANAIEKALNAVYARIMGIINSFQYSGEIFAGEETGI